jgi:hypothetical protein
MDGLGANPDLTLRFCRRLRELLRQIHREAG